MALTVNRLAEVTKDGVRVVYGTVTTDDSHAAGGEDFSIQAAGLQTLLSLMFFSVGGYVFGWNGSTTDPKMDAYESGTADGPLNEADAEDFSTLVIPFIAIGH